MNLHRQIPVSSPGALVSSHVTRVRRISRGGWIRRGEKKYEPPSFRATWSITLPKPLLGLEKWSFVSAQSGDKMRQYDHCKDNRLLSVTVYSCNHTNGQRSFLLLPSHSLYPNFTLTPLYLTGTVPHFPLPLWWALFII